MIKAVLVAIASMTLAAAAYAQSYGTISQPDYFGQRHIQYNNGVNGTISTPDYFGQSHFQYNNGVSGTISQPDYFGQSHIQYQTMPRRSAW